MRWLDFFITSYRYIWAVGEVITGHRIYDNKITEHNRHRQHGRHHDAAYDIGHHNVEKCIEPACPSIWAASIRRGGVHPVQVVPDSLVYIGKNNDAVGRGQHKNTVTEWFRRIGIQGQHTDWKDYALNRLGHRT